MTELSTAIQDEAPGKCLNKSDTYIIRLITKSIYSFQFKALCLFLASASAQFYYNPYPGYNYNPYPGYSYNPYPGYNYNSFISPSQAYYKANSAEQAYYDPSIAAVKSGPSPNFHSGAAPVADFRQGFGSGLFFLQLRNFLNSLAPQTFFSNLMSLGQTPSLQTPSLQTPSEQITPELAAAIIAASMSQQQQSPSVFSNRPNRIFFRPQTPSVPTNNAQPVAAQGVEQNVDNFESEVIQSE